MVKKHYKQNNGKLAVWGSIKNYIFKYDDKSIAFDIKGNIIKDKIDVVENVAFIRVK